MNNSPTLHERAVRSASPDEAPYVIGVLGGMGPAATADFYSKLVEATPATRDQDHRRVIIWSDPTVPDRTEALQGAAPDPTPWLLHGARRLREAGATHIAIPCNTAHAFVPGLNERVGIPIVHMIDEVARALAGRSPRIRRAGLLATNGTVGSGLYQDWLHRHDIELVLPDPAQQETVMATIRAIKSGRRGPADVGALAVVADQLVAGGAQAVIAGCTEIPLGLTDQQVTVPLVDPARVLADAMVRITSPPAV